MCTRYPIINRVSELKVHIELTRFVQPEKIEIDANERAVNEKSQYCFFVCTTFDSFLNDFKPIGAKLLYFLKFNPPHPHMIQLSLILCTLTDMRCQFKLQVFGMFMHNIIFSQCIFKHIIHNFYCITAKQWI